jgi:hypothetical protein
MTQQQRTVAKPIPIPTQETDFYWEKCHQHELWVRKCNDCRQAYFYPRDFCPNCFSRNTAWIRCSGKGTLHTFGVVVRPPHRAWAEDVPFVVAMVDLQEGCRIPTNLVQVAIDPSNPGKNIKVGMPVEVVWEDRTDKISLPMFRPA